jgi:predicted Zn-dependent protease
VKTKKYSEAVAQFMTGLRASPSDALSNLELGRVYVLQGKNAEGIACLQKGVSLDPANPDNRQTFAEGLKKAGRLREAVAQYREALRLRPGFSEVHDSLSALTKMLNLAD